MTVRSFLRRPRTWLVGVPLLLVLGAVAGPFVYIHFVQGDPPARLGFDPPASTATTAARTTGNAGATIDGTWQVAGGSQAGYRVGEVLFGQDAEAVGRTQDVTGDAVIAGTTITSASFTVDLTTVASNEGRRDNQFRGRIMETGTFPTASFVLTEPITIDAIPSDLEQIGTTATGDFTIHGVTRTTTFDLSARRNGATIEVNGTIPVVFADYGIADPSFGPATVQDHGEIEFLLVLELLESAGG